MLLYLFLLFTLVPLIELTLLFWVSSQTSIFFTILLVIFTGVIGAALAKRQGLQTWVRIHKETSAGRPPTDALLDGLMILMAGAFLVTPGILTDAVGFSLLIPPVRAVIRKYVAAYFAHRVKMQVSHFGSQFSPGTNGVDGSYQPSNPDDVIDVQFTRKTADDEPARNIE